MVMTGRLWHCLTTWVMNLSTSRFPSGAICQKVGGHLRGHRSGRRRRNHRGALGGGLGETAGAEAATGRGTPGWVLHHIRLISSPGNHEFSTSMLVWPKVNVLLWGFWTSCSSKICCRLYHYSWPMFSWDVYQLLKGSNTENYTEK